MSRRFRLLPIALFAAAAACVAACGLEVTGLDGTASTQGDGGDDATVDGATIDAPGDDVQGGDAPDETSGGDDAAQDVDIADVDLDGGMLDVETDGDAGTATCPNGSYACGGICVTNCAFCFGAVGCPIGNVCVPSCQAGCGTLTTACYQCGGGNPVATCQDPKTATCLKSPYTHCGCNGAVPCPGETFCAGKPSHTACYSCGENGTNDKICGASTGKCDEAKALCK